MSTPTSPSETHRSTTSSCTLCCKCVDLATYSCLDCDLFYCGSCCEQRHSKGSFLRHEVKSIDDPFSNQNEQFNGVMPCEECRNRTVKYRCSACELSYCKECSDDIHRNGKLQCHVELGLISTIDSSNQSDIFLSPLGRNQRLLSDATDDNGDAELWSSWNVFRPSNGTSWTNPASDDTSSSSDEELKASSISSAFKNLALDHISSSQSDFSSFVPSSNTWSLESPPPQPSMSQNDLEDLFASLESTRPSRHVVVRSIARHLSTAEVRNISQIMHSFGQVAQVVSSLSSQGLILYSYFELRAAVYAVNRYQEILAEDPSHLTVGYGVPYEPATNLNHAVIDVSLERIDHLPFPTTDNLRQFCNQFGEVASVVQADVHVGSYRVEYNDTRHVANAIMELNQSHCIESYRRMVSAQLASLPPHTQKLLESVQSAVDKRTIPIPTPQYDLWTDSPTKFGSPIFPSKPMQQQFNPFVPPPPPFPQRRPPQPSPPSTTPENEFSLGIERVHKGEDRRTTLMIRNIPNKYTQTMLLAEINQNHQGEYDFFYLPIDFKNKCNMGYAFINFMEYEAIVPFYQAFNGQKWRNFNSEKVCAISYARLQGKAAMIARFQNSSLLEKHESYRPLVFKSNGPDKGRLEPFPAPRVSTKSRPMIESTYPSYYPSYNTPVYPMYRHPYPFHSTVESQEGYKRKSTIHG